MKVQGNVKIELTDVESGEVTTVEQTNMMTNAVNNILGINPLATFYKPNSSGNTLTAWQDNLLPICPNMIGGILLFPDSLEEDVDNLYPTSDNLPVAYASNDVNSTSDLQRGGLSQTEGGATDTGYEFVWEFSNTQGNGTIAAVALTSAQGGCGGYGSAVDDTSMILVMSYLSDSSVDSDMKKLLFEAVEADFENNTIVCIDYTSSAVTISKVRIPILSIGLNELIDDTTAEIIESYTVTCSTFAPSSTYHCFLDGGDGYWYGLGNSANSSGDATLKWIKISKDDYSYEEGSYTLSGVTLVYAGSRSYSSYPSNRTKSVMRDGYAYIPAYDLTGVYKINIGNEADISLIELGFTSGGKSLSSSSYGLFLDRIGDLIIGYDYQITADDEVIATAGGAKFPYTCTPMMQYKNFILCWGGEYGSANRYLALLTPYMASICNLGSAVVKTSDMTMKITYTLTEVDSTDETEESSDE